MNLIDALRFRGITSDSYHTGFFFAFTHIDNSLTKHFIIVTIEQAGKLYKIIHFLIFSRIGEVEVMAPSHIENPDALFTSLQNHGKAQILTLLVNVLLLTLVGKQTFKEV